MAGRQSHGLKGSREYNVWMGIKERCYNKNSSSYKYYGAKGVKMCDEWLNSMVTFYDWLHKNGYDNTAPFGKFTVDRINSDGDYSPENCRLTTLKEQCYNRSSNNMVTYNGETKTISEFSRQYNLNINTLKKRIKNWGICDKTFLYPAKVGNNQYGKSNVICKK
jgi:hypothetical protein